MGARKLNGGSALASSLTFAVHAAGVALAPLLKFALLVSPAVVPQVRGSVCAAPHHRTSPSPASPMQYQPCPPFAHLATFHTPLPPCP